MLSATSLECVEMLGDHLELPGKARKPFGGLEYVDSRPDTSIPSHISAGVLS